MLVLSRHTRESVMIGDCVEVVVLEVVGPDRVRLGFRAPDDVRVFRREIYDAIRRDRERDDRPA